MIHRLLPNSKKIKTIKYFFTTDNKIIDLMSYTALKIACLFFLSRMIIAVSEMKASVKLNPLYVLSPVSCL